MRTPAPVVEAAVEWLNDLADEAELAQRRPPGAEF
jgi:hypothetical protein